jgi:peptidoglycan/LPS O-acetylase OafA/YrhL
LVLGLVFPDRLALPTQSLDRLINLVLNAVLAAPLFGQRPIMDVSWTLTVLLVYYIACPILVRMVNRVPDAFRIPVLSLVFVAVLVQPWFSNRFALMIAGGLIFELSRGRISPLIGAGVPLLCGITFFALPGTQLLALAVLFCWLAIHMPPAWLSHPWLRWIGCRGFAFYLGHGLPMLGFFVFIGPWLTDWQIFAAQPLVFCASLGFSAFMHEMSERGRKRAPAAAKPAAAPAVPRLQQSIAHEAEPQRA